VTRNELPLLRVLCFGFLRTETSSQNECFFFVFRYVCAIFLQ
jgi:hypothetical protein